MTRNFLSKAVLLIFIFISLSIRSRLLYGQDSSDIYSPDNILAFGNFLFCEKDYLRAIQEYKRYLSFRNDDSIKFKIAFGYQAMEYFNASEIEADKISLASLRRNVFYLKMKNKFLKKDYTGLRTLYAQSAFKSSVSEVYHFSFLMDSSELPDKNSFINAYKDDSKQAVEKFYYRKMNPGNKSLVLSGILSAVIPGAGKIYSGSIGDGITAAILTGLLSFISYDSFRANHNFKGWLFTGITAFFYVGNIYGSIAAAHLHNEEVRLKFISELENYIKANNYFLPDYEPNCN